MIPLFIESLANGDWGALEQKVLVVLIMWAIVFIAITVDLISGVHKAKQRKEARTSIGYRQTVNKAIRYYSIMLFALLADCLIGMFWSVPVASAVAAGYLVFVEWKSVLEKADEKVNKQLRQHAAEYIKFLQSVKDKDLNKLINHANREILHSGRVDKDQSAVPEHTERNRDS